MQEQEHGLLQGNNNLQQPDAMEQPGSETQATIEALTELLQASEALLELHKANEAQFQRMQQVIQTIEHTRAYRLLASSGALEIYRAGAFGTFPRRIMAYWRPLLSPGSCLPPKPLRPIKLPLMPCDRCFRL